MIMDYDKIPKHTARGTRVKIMTVQALADGTRHERAKDLDVIAGTVAHTDRSARKHVRRPVTTRVRSARWIRAHLREQAHRNETSSFVNQHERSCVRCTHEQW